jgi:PPOX class probable F420-dependent enzyme
MRLDPPVCHERMAASRVARLASVGSDQRPHVVPVTFALDGDRLVTAIDQKPKSTTVLKRLKNIAENPLVTVLCDHYEDDWTRLWWVRADGSAAIVTEGDVWRGAIASLTAKYHQYAVDPPRGPAIVVTIESWSGWSPEQPARLSR